MKLLEKMGGRGRKSAGRKSTGRSSSTATTTTDKDFGPQLQRNNIVHAASDARAPDDVAYVRELLDQPRESEPPDPSAYKEYLTITEDHENELAVEISAYPLLSKRTAGRGISGYFQRPNHAWSAVDNHLTTRLSDAQPDIVESYRKTDYPPRAVEALSADLAPSSYNEAMPAYAVEFKSSNGDTKEAKLQCAYDGALMTEGARAKHKYLSKSDDDFYGKTQALTVAFNGEILNFYGHHAVRIPTPSHPTTYDLAGNGRGNAEAATETATAVEYHQYLLNCDNPRASFENFQTAYRHTRNAQDIGYQWATKRKDALWAYANTENTQTSPNVLISLQQTSNDSVALLSATPDEDNCDAYDDGVHPTDQLLRECRRSSAANNEDFSVPILTADNGDASPDALIHNPITPPQSSKDVSLPLGPQQLSGSVVIEAREEVGSNVHGHRKTRRVRVRTASTVEADPKSNARRSRRKH